MTDFNFDLFNKPDQYEETLLRDRKAMVEYWKDSEKAEFVRDVIALANTARMLGKPAYLILGVRDAADDTTDDICGIGEMFERQVQQGKTEKQAFEEMRKELAAIIRQHIFPLLSPEIFFNKIAEKVVGYVLIQPLTGEPFRVSREFRSGRQTYLRPGQCWLRFGESKSQVTHEELAPADDRLRYSYAEIPYVLPSIWERYFNEVQRKMQNLWQKFDPPEESAYQELRDKKGIAIQKRVDDFLAQNDDRLLILQGAAGCGKSLFLQRLVNDLAKQGEQEMKDAQRVEQFTPPNGLIPIYCQLKYLTCKARTESAHFTKTLCNLLAPLWENNEHGRRPIHPEKLFEDLKLDWLIVLDGLDEIGEYARRKEFLRVLNEFMQTYPRLRVILTTRPNPGGQLDKLDNAKLIEIALLDENQVSNFFLAYRTDKNDQEIYSFIQRCKMWGDAWNLLRVPAYLNAVALSIGIARTITDTEEKEETKVEVAVAQDTFSIDANSNSNNQGINEIPNKSGEASLEVDQPVTPESTERLEEERQDEEFIKSMPQLLDQVYEAFWKRERERCILENIDRFRCSTHEIAAVSMNVFHGYVSRGNAKRRLTEKGLRWVLEMGILSENEHEHIFFTLPSTQVYSAAKKLQGDIEGKFWKDVSRYICRWKDSYRAQIETFYQDLTGKSLSTILQLQGGSNG